MDNKFKCIVAFGGFILFVIIIGTLSFEENDGLLITNDNEMQSGTQNNLQFEIYNGDENFNGILVSGDDENQNHLQNIPKICVHIIGAVKKPGIIELPIDSRLYQAVDLAEGLLEEADETRINLAKILQDEEQIIIPYKKSANKNEMTKNINKLFDESFSSASNNTSNNLSNNITQGKININTATKEELKTLTGIGDSTADKIINYRNEVSKFEKIEDLKNVSGIGDSKFNAIKDKIKV